MHDAVSDCDQPVMREVLLQEVPEIFDRTLVAERRVPPRLLGDDEAGRVVCPEPRCCVQSLDLSVELACQFTGTLGEHRELQTGRAGIQNEDRVAGFSHRRR
jgi:hypothetical protein